MTYNIQLNKNNNSIYDQILLKSTDQNILLSNVPVSNFNGTTVSEALLELKQNIPDVSTVEKATPIISIDNNGLITATATQNTGYVTTGTKINTKQVPVVTQGMPAIGVSYSGLITSTNNLTSGYAKSETHSSTKQLETVEVAEPVVTNSAGTIVSTTTQLDGFTKGGTKSKILQLSTKSSATITPKTTNQTISSGLYLTGAQTIQGSSNLVPSNIKSGVSIFNVAGSLQLSTITINSISLKIVNARGEMDAGSTVESRGVDFFILSGNKSGDKYIIGEDKSPYYYQNTVQYGSPKTVTITYPSVLYIDVYMTAERQVKITANNDIIKSIEYLPSNNYDAYGVSIPSTAKVTLNPGYSSATITVGNGDIIQYE